MWLKNLFKRSSKSKIIRKIDKRKISYHHTNSGLTSKRVSLILSNVEDSENLAKAVRALRHNDKENISFKLTNDTQKKIKSKQLQGA